MSGAMLGIGLVLEEEWYNERPHLEVWPAKDNLIVPASMMTVIRATLSEASVA